MMPDKRVIKRGRKGKPMPNLVLNSQDHHTQRASLLRAGSTLLPIQMSQTGRFDVVHEEDDEIVAYGDMKKTLPSVGQLGRSKLLGLPSKATI
jgi:hypothetical protein